MKLDISIDGLRDYQVEAIEHFLWVIQHLGNTGSSRNVSMFIDGDGTFRPSNITVNGAPVKCNDYLRYKSNYYMHRNQNYNILIDPDDVYLKNEYGTNEYLYNLFLVNGDGVTDRTRLYYFNPNGFKIGDVLKIGNKDLKIKFIGYYDEMPRNYADLFYNDFYGHSEYPCIIFEDDSWKLLKEFDFIIKDINK